MAKVKNVPRKPRPKLRKAMKRFVCGYCHKVFTTQQGNFRRHLGLLHGVTMTGEPVDVATLARFRANAIRGPRQRPQPSCDQPNQLIHCVSQSQLSYVINDAVTLEVDETQSHMQPAVVKEEPNDVCFLFMSY